MIYYVYLGLAIVLELVGTSLLKFTKGFTVLLPTCICLLCYGFCFFFFSKSLDHIHLGMAYAIWCGIGIVVSTLLSVFLFKESISYIAILGIFLVLVGVILLNLA
ncbi:MAG: DMT family transporter [Traorella sp.]